MLKDVSRIASEVSWKEFAIKFCIMFFICMPVPSMGMALAGYCFANRIGYPHGTVPAIMVLVGAILGVALGFFLTMLVIMVGHKNAR